MSFDTINYLLFDKRKKELDSNLLNDFNTYLTTRYASFINNGQFVNYINDTLNRYSNIFDTNEDKFKFFNNVIIKTKRHKVDYIKKKKQNKLEELQNSNKEFY